MLGDALANAVQHLGMETAEVPRLLAGRSRSGRAGPLSAPLAERPVLAGIGAPEADDRPHELAHPPTVFCDPSLMVRPPDTLVTIMAGSTVIPRLAIRGPRMRSIVIRYSAPGWM